MARTAHKQKFFPSIPQNEDRMSFVENKIKTVAPLKANTKNQKVYLNKLRNKHHDILVAVGPAGTGKTYMAVRDAIAQLQSGDITKIVITRPVVAVGEDLGYLPGSLTEKMAPWTRPIIDVFMECYSAHEVQRMIADETIEIAPLAYMRGRTFKDALVILDEAQNTTPEQMKMFLTRPGNNCRQIVTGDIRQFDEREMRSESGLTDLLHRLAKRDQEARDAEPTLPGFITEGLEAGRVGGPYHPPQEHRWERIGLVRLTKADVSRHPVVTEVLELYGEAD